MTAAQPNAMQSLAGTISDSTAEETVTSGKGAEGQEGEPQPEYVGDMPTDPEQARTYRPGDQQTEDRSDEGTR